MSYFLLKQFILSTNLTDYDCATLISFYTHLYEVLPQSATHTGLKKKHELSTPTNLKHLFLQRFKMGFSVFISTMLLQTPLLHNAPLLQSPIYKTPLIL